jgi:4'-phosphopantetheinyl transferase
MQLADGDVHVWILRVADVAPGVLANLGEWLTDDERTRERAFRADADRDHFRLTRWLQRWALSKYAPVDPADWRFTTEPGGRPVVVSPRFPFSFNASNTTGMIALAVCRDVVGVDVENVTCRETPFEVAEQVFVDFELAALRALPADLQRQRFYELWTLKEAYLKARGEGLAIPLQQFGFRHDTDELVFEVEPTLGDDATAWRFRRLALGSDHQGAVAVRRPARSELRITQLAAGPG